MIFRSHLLSMIVFALIVSLILAFLKYDEPEKIKKYFLKLLINMIGGVILFSWLMYLT